MGHGIARVFASVGVPVRLADRTLGLARAGRDAIAEGLSDTAAAVVDLVTPVGDTADAVAGAALVIEAVPEDLVLKRAVWQAIGAHAPRGATLASNTSSYDIGLLAEAAGAPERVLGMHWYNPPYLVPCVEVVRTDAVAPDRVAAVLGWLTALGKRPAVTANTAGFVGNRLQFAMVAEAFRCLAEGVATAPDIDAIVRGSFGFRLGDYGPFEIADLAGLDVYRAILDYLAEHLGERFAAPSNLVELAAAGRCGAKSGHGVYE
jgi:3-hydroxybutyryl-CoA dehydrogenase